MELDENITLSKRSENTREARPVKPIAVKFSLEEIKNHFDESMSEVRKQFDVANELEQNDNLIACKIVWRSQVVLAEGLLDFYLHEISKFCLERMFNGVIPKTDKYKSFPVTMEKVEQALESSYDWFFDYLNERFSRDVFLSFDSMRDQLNLIGIKFTSVMVKAFPAANEKESINKGKQIITNLFKRRNEIAHQNDRSHYSAEQTDITREFVEDYIGNIETIVYAIQEIASEITGRTTNSDDQD